MDEIKILELTIQTLNTVEVRGEENLAAQLGAIRALKSLYIAMSQPRDESKATEDPGHIGGFDIPHEEVTADG